MIEMLSDRLNKHKQEYKNNIADELIIEKLLFECPSLYGHKLYNSTSIFKNKIYLTLYLYSIELLDEIFLDVVPEISKFSKNWKVSIEDESITLTNIFNIDNRTISLTINYIQHDSNSCKIVKIPTGRMVKKTKYIEIDELEYKTVVECLENE